MSHADWAGKLQEHQGVMERSIERNRVALDRLTTQLSTIFAQGGKLLVCGNGGSACDAMHIAGEFVGRFKQERQGLPAIALSADTSILTAVGNDYGFERVFARQVEAYGQPGDMLIAMSTSGTSPNVVKAIETARERQLVTVLFTGEKGLAQADKVDLLIAATSTDTARIQETHIFMLHILAEQIERQVMEMAA